MEFILEGAHKGTQNVLIYIKDITLKGVSISLTMVKVKEFNIIDLSDID